ncbi:MAG: Na+/H+ antiporter subunit E [Ignavibacteria bacterium]|nr:Na+/H+ antiporter subunit E [Ignavibacteria bacterium]MBT8381882.1 Na+/H+ antiporter subunit E [Ignavibacteria bacterium]MBT8391060.1 Na+/H+ antiporter subunit E [Ignavibacteria bacterium]NNJ54465.1 Na+/H+ antiporter subunit E [Ignavibacteriaceae bacterium]NNL21846.1 Na+/H+ antiporter subunit E [Ignavibacteriaceae bacterium]
MKNQFLLNILLAIAWMLLTGELTVENFIEGLIIGYLILWISKSALGGTKYFKKIPKAIGFFFYFIKELIVANLKVAFDIVTPKDYMQPGIIAVPLDAETDMEITLLANLITLTPGSLSLDVSRDKKTLYVHSLYIEDADELRKIIKQGLERKLLEVLR